ncbi:MAG: hypothetical protein IT497_01475 [Ottowia sp.]|nr:hypothetical protein [Ottowia sp.]
MNTHLLNQRIRACKKIMADVTNLQIQSNNRLSSDENRLYITNAYAGSDPSMHAAAMAKHKELTKRNDGLQAVRTANARFMKTEHLGDVNQVATVVIRQRYGNCHERSLVFLQKLCALHSAQSSAPNAYARLFYTNPLYDHIFLAITSTIVPGMVRTLPIYLEDLGREAVIADAWQDHVYAAHVDCEGPGPSPQAEEVRKKVKTLPLHPEIAAFPLVFS